MTKVLEDLGWPTLETGGKYMRQFMLHKIINNEIDMKLPPYVKASLHLHNSMAIYLHAVNHVWLSSVNGTFQGLQVKNILNSDQKLRNNFKQAD